MKIQSIQNQQMQSRPNFGAYGAFKPYEPKIYDGIFSLEGSVTPLNEVQINLLLDKLKGLVDYILPVKLSEKMVKRFTRRQDYVREFELGEDRVVLVGQPKLDTSSMYLIHPNGETQIFRNDRLGILTKDKEDPRFDAFAEALDAKPQIIE